MSVCVTAVKKWMNHKANKQKHYIVLLFVCVILCTYVHWDRYQKGGFAMTIEQGSQQIPSQFIVPVSLLLLVGVVGAVAGGAGGFIINQFQRRDIQTQEIGGKRRS